MTLARDGKTPCLKASTASGLGPQRGSMASGNVRSRRQVGMIYLVDNNGVEEPGINLALEEHCLRRMDPGRRYLILYVNRPCVVVGRHQNILAEADVEFLRSRSIPVLRRISGGGTVYHDRGNINIAFIQTHTRRSLANIQRELEPLRRTLKQLAVPSEFDHRSNLFIATRKISGNAQFSDTRRILIHATLLFDSDLQLLTRSLQADTGGLRSKAPRSFPSAVANVSDHLRRQMSRRDFCGRLVTSIAETCGGLQHLRLEGRHWDAVDRLNQSKYRRWSWNWGKTPTFRIHRRGRGPKGSWQIDMEVREGCLRNIRFSGALHSEGFTTELETTLGGVRFEPDSIRTRMEALRSRGALPSGYEPETVTAMLWQNRALPDRGRPARL